MANTKKFSKTRKNSFKKRNNKLNTQKGGIFGIKTPEIFKKTPAKCIEYDGIMKIVCKNKPILNALLVILEREKINGQDDKYEYDLEKLKKDIETKSNNINKTYQKYHTTNLEKEELENLYNKLNILKKNKNEKIKKEIQTKMEPMKNNKNNILTIIKFIFSINNNNDKFFNNFEKLLDRYIHDRETKLIYSHIYNKKETDFYDNEFDNYLKTIEERLIEIENINTSQLLKKYQNQQEREQLLAQEQQEREQLLAQEKQEQKQREQQEREQQKEQNKKTLKEYFLGVSSQFKNSKGKNIQRIHFIGRIDDNNNDNVDTVVEGLPKDKINAIMLALLKQTFTEKEELINFFTELKKEALRNYFYNTSEIQKNYNGKHLNKRIHILTKKKINNVNNNNIKNNKKVNNTVNSLFKQGNMSYIQPEMLTLLKNTFTSKSKLLEFLRELKADKDLPEGIYETLNNASGFKIKEQLNIEKDLKTYFKNNKQDINKDWLEIIREDSRSYTVKQAIDLIFCIFTEQGRICYTDEKKLTELENYANGNIKTLLDFIDNLDNESDYVEMFKPEENIYEDQNSIQLREYFANKINMVFFNKIKEYVEFYKNININNKNTYQIEDKYNNIIINSKKYTFNEIVENLFSCKITQNNKKKMECKIDIDMIKKLKEYTKNIKTLVEFLSELLEEAGINTNEYASFEISQIPEKNLYTSYMSKINPTYQNYPPIPSRSSKPLNSPFIVNKGYAHRSNFRKGNKNKTTEYSRLKRGNTKLNRYNTVYTEPNFTNDNDNDTYATVFPLATVDRQNVAQPKNPNFIKNIKPFTFSRRSSNARPRTSTRTRALSSSIRTP